MYAFTSSLPLKRPIGRQWRGSFFNSQDKEKQYQHRQIFLPRAVWLAM